MYLDDGSVIKTQEVAVELPETVQVEGVDGDVGGDFMGVPTGALPVLSKLGGGGGRRMQ